MSSRTSFGLMQLLSWPSLVTPYVGHPRWYGILKQLMMGGCDSSYHVDPRSPEDCVVRRCCVKDTELYDDIVWIHPDQKFDCAGRAGIASVKSVKKRLGLRDCLSGQLRSSSIQSKAYAYRMLTLLPPSTKIFDILQQPMCIITTKTLLCGKCGVGIFLREEDGPAPVVKVGMSILLDSCLSKLH